MSRSVSVYVECDGCGDSDTFATPTEERDSGWTRKVSSLPAVYTRSNAARPPADLCPACSEQASIDEVVRVER